MFNLIRKFIYKLRLDNKLRNMDVTKLLGVMSKYNKFVRSGEVSVPFNLVDGDVLGLANSDNSYDIFYGNIHIYYQSDNNQTICRLSLKRDDEGWTLGNVFSEGIKTMEVYLTYDIEVLGNRRCVNTIFKDGNWNEYVYKALRDVEEIINGYTIEAQFNKAYAEKKQKKVAE